MFTMSSHHNYRMLREDDDIRPITRETCEEYVDRMRSSVSVAGSGLKSTFTCFDPAYSRYAYDEYHVWGHELVEGAFTIALLAAVKDMGGPWWRADLFERDDWSDDEDGGHCGCSGTRCLGTCAQSDA